MPRKYIVATIGANLPGEFLTNRSIIYNIPYEYVLRGFLVEGTAYKEDWRLHDFTFALFRTHKFLHMSDCREIRNANPESGVGFKGDDKTVVADALQSIHASDLLTNVLRGCSPREYLERYHVPDLDDARPNAAFDLGCAAGLCGDLVYARKGLEAARRRRVEVARLYGPYTDHESFLQQVAERLEAVDGGVDVFRAAQQRATTAAAAAHGFCPPTFGEAAG